MQTLFDIPLLKDPNGSLAPSDLQKVYNILYEHVGKENSIKLADMAKVLNMNGRLLKSYVHSILHNYSVMIIGDSNGYYLPANDEEIESCIRMMEGQAFSRLKRVSKLKKMKVEQYFENLYDRFQDIEGDLKKDSEEPQEPGGWDDLE
jgi:hypothetical protein